MRTFPARGVASLVLLAAATFASTAVYGQASLTLEAEAWTEAWLVERPVSGGMRVGLMAIGKADAVDPEGLRVMLPDTEAEKLCVRVRSVDGRYSATLEYDVANMGGGVARLLIGTTGNTTRYGDRLSRYSPEQLAVLASTGAGCTERAEAYAVASWGVGTSDTLAVFLNSDLPTRIVTAVSGSVEGQRRCSELTGDLVTYNLRCDVPVAWAVPPNELFVRVRRGRHLETIPIPINGVAAGER